MAGCDAAQAAGFTHALQIDADGQHDVADAARLLEVARRQPAAMISGEAIYDSTVPRSRRYGRYLTHVWVWINTLSFEIRDSMCGLRVYPLAATCAMWQRPHVGQRMDFDTEIMVRLCWRGVPDRRGSDAGHLSTRWRVALQDAGGQRLHQPHAHPFVLRNVVALPPMLSRRVSHADREGGRMTLRAATVEIVDSVSRRRHGRHRLARALREVLRDRALRVARQFDYGYDAMRESGFMWPVIDMRVRYIQAVRFGQRMLVKATLARMGKPPAHRLPDHGPARADND